MEDTSSIRIDVYDGTRRLLGKGRKILYRLIDGNQEQRFCQARKTSSLKLGGLKFFDNWGDDYAVIVSSDGYRQSGFVPVRLTPKRRTLVDLMLIPKAPAFDFSAATWEAVKAALPFLSSGVSDAVGRARYEQLKTNAPPKLAALLNITTAMGQIQLPRGTPLDYLKRLKWDDSLGQDRFFAYCGADLIEEVRTAAEQGAFAPEVGAAFFHPGATASWKQVQFGEANVQLTFHEGDTKTIGGADCIAVEVDIDYYKDPAAHTLLEVFPNKLTGGLTDPAEAYVLRWIAARHAGVQEFAPPYTIVSA